MSEHDSDATTPDEFGYLALFDPYGNEIPASREDLLSIEGMSFDKELHRRVVNNRSGDYWLVSDRPGFHAMLLEVTVFHCYPREGDRWEIGYCTNGVASYPHWDLEVALKTINGHVDVRDWPGATGVPEKVVAIARERVAYRLGRTPGPDPLDLHGVRTRDAVAMRERFTEFLEGTVDATSLIRQLAGKRIAVMELMLAVTFFCAEHGLVGKEADILNILVPEDQHERLIELAGVLEEQLGSE